MSSLSSLKRAPAMLLVLVSFCGFAQEPVEVTIKEYRFQPDSVTIKVGGTVKWRNAEKRTSHSVVFPKENGLESERMMPDDSWQRRFDTPGRYPYSCGPHPEMRGLIEVIE